MHHAETNPHFHRLFQPHFQDQSPIRPEHHDARHLAPSMLPKGSHGQPRDQHGLTPRMTALQGGTHGQSPQFMASPEGVHDQSPHSAMLPEAHHGLPPRSMVPPEGQYSNSFYPNKVHTHHQEEPKPSSQQRHGRRTQQLDGRTQDGGTCNRMTGPQMPVQRQTNPLIWFTAVFCAIFWLVIIVGGLIVLIIYLVFRPKSPRFDIPTATLNAAYLDMGYLLNADLSLLANFTNPNHKVSVDFSYNIINLYYGETLISTQYIEPFSAAKVESKFANIHMVSSQVRLPIVEAQRLKKQMESNGVVFHVRGFFRARSNFGGLLRYSYWLYSHCRLELAGSPSGVLVSSKCRTKR